MMKHILTLVCTACVLFCLSPEAVGLPHTSKQTKAAGEIWVLHQTHTDAGPEEIFIAQDAIKVINQRSGYELLCKAPKWEVHGFRRSEKLEWIAPLSLFDGLLLYSPRVRPHKNKSIFFPESKGSLLGLRYTHFTPSGNSLSFINGTAEIVTAPSALEFLCRLYRCPNTQTMPLQISTDRGKRTLPKFRMGVINTGMGRDLRSGLIEELSTQSWKKIHSNAETFALPVGFKRTMTLPQVTFSNSMKNQFNDMFRDGTGFRGELHGSSK